MTAGQLISALEDGKVIYIDYKIIYPDQYWDDSQEFIKEIVMTASKSIFRYGWGSALGRIEDEINQIIQHPEYYQIKEKS